MNIKNNAFIPQLQYRIQTISFKKSSAWLYFTSIIIYKICEMTQDLPKTCKWFYGWKFLFNSKQNDFVQLQTYSYKTYIIISLISLASFSSSSTLPMRCRWLFLIGINYFITFRLFIENQLILKLIIQKWEMNE